MVTQSQTVELPFEVEYCRERMDWLVKLRWLAITGVALTAAIASVIDLVATWAPLVLIALGMCVYNGLLLRWLFRHKTAELHSMERMILLQLLLDFLSLSLLLHFSDSVENPFVILFAFPAAIGAKLLPARKSFVLTLTGICFYSGMIIGEFTGVLSHHEFTHSEVGGPADSLFRSNLMLFGYLFALAILLLGLTYFVGNLSRRLRWAHSHWRQREQAAQSRERLARIGQIAAGVAHSIRNPLHGLINARDLISKHIAPDSTAQRTLALMDEAFRRIDKITTRLLVLTRDAPLATQLTDLDVLVSDTLSIMVSSLAGETRVPIEFRRGEVGVATVDPDQLSEALANVIHNAVQACESSGEVLVTTRRSDQADDQVLIEIRDTGTGIALEDLRHLFDPFFTTKAVGAGTGLGLNISRRIIEGHGGKIEISSHANEGTHVTIVLPRQFQQATEDIASE